MNILREKLGYPKQIVRTKSMLCEKEIVYGKQMVYKHVYIKLICHGKQICDKK